MPALLQDVVRTGRARLVIRDFPLDLVALGAAALVRCLPEGERLQAHRRLLDGQLSWSSGTVSGAASAASFLGLPAERRAEALACAETPAAAAAVVSAASEATADYGIKATPGFVVGRRVHTGGMEATAIADELTRAGL